jgi:tetratricopeptide (TPR) repeat protein
MMKRLILFILIGSFSVAAFAQNERKYVRRGNKLFMEAVKDTTRLDTTKFRQAEEEYRKALNLRPGNEQWNFNLAGAQYKQMRFEEAERKFEELAEKFDTPEEQARALHNIGNSQLMQQRIDESIESYKEALRRNPNDLDTKYNLAYAQMLKNQRQQQQQNQDQQQKQNQNQQDQQNQDQQNNQNQQQNQDQQNEQQNQDQQQQQQQQQTKISRQDAEQLLQALQNDERDIQEKVKKEKAAKARRIRTEKEW